MRYFPPFILLVFALFVRPAAAVEPPSAYQPAEIKTPQETITLVADEWCPYNCAENASDSGYIVDLATEIFKEKNIKVIYKVIPWERAISNTREGEYQGIIAISKIEGGDDFIYHDNEIGINTNYFYVKAPNPWRYAGVSSLQFVTIGLTQGYAYGDIAHYISQFKEDNLRIQIIASDNAVDNNVKKLLAGRITAIYEDKFVEDYYLAKEKLSDIVTEAGTAHKTTVPLNDYLYIGFSKKNHKAEKYSAILSDGIDKFRKNGNLAKIIKKYHLKDWKEPEDAKRS